ncbi:type I pullulanase [Aerococcaceae bacterium NML191292]|nr:type I pullulanase [Aerococcaceae bacterium NML191292]
MTYQIESLTREALLAQTRTETFIQNQQYHGDLGAIYTAEQTVFKLWAPTAERVELLIYDGHYGGLQAIYPMAQTSDGQVYFFAKEGDCHGMTYRYQLSFPDGTVTKTVDPYAKAVTVNGQRGVVVDLSRTNPENWGERLAPLPLEETIVYELHIRDFTSSKQSGAKHKGKYLGVIEKGTANSNGESTGLDYLQELGVTHVELLPFFDYVTVDETLENPVDYNWGYDPLNYNVPEGSYATNAYDPFVRIRELKQMIQGLHDAGIRVIMDVVYNHVYQVERHPFHHTVPGYFFRQNDDGSLSNGTGVGNDTASERPMMRKFIVDSIKYWAKEYHIDGFRFDLMGIHDVETMQEVRRALDEIDPSIIVFGEGWDLMTPLAHHEKASHHNAPQMAGVGQFNDGLREALKGNDFEAAAKGFVNGAWYQERKAAINMMACLDYQHYLVPQQLIQYVESHDNFTLFDKLRGASPELEMATIIRQHQLATTMVLLAQGIPFLHAGQEFLRTKHGVRDSYNKPDTINQLDWARRSQFAANVAYVQKIIALRKAEPLFRMTDYRAIQQSMRVLRADYQIVALQLADYILVFNAQQNILNYELPAGDYQLVVHDGEVYLDNQPIIQVERTIAIQSYRPLVVKKLQKLSAEN